MQGNTETSSTECVDNALGRDVSFSWRMLRRLRKNKETHICISGFVLWFHTRRYDLNGSVCFYVAISVRCRTFRRMSSYGLAPISVISAPTQCWKGYLHPVTEYRRMTINVICNVFSYITQSESCLVYQTGLFWCVLLFQLAEEH